jgi:predicted Zn finger-like uncharacterized protein
MNVTCPNCATVYRVDPAKVPETGVRARCAVCSAVFAVEREGRPARAPETVAVAAPAPAARAEPPRAEPVPPAPPVARPEPPKPAAPSLPPVAAPRPAASPPAVAPAGAVPPRPATPQRPPAPATVPVSAAAPAAAAAPAPPPAAPVQSASSAPAPAPVSRPPAAPAPGSRPVNPFLSQDPSLKARRLARALISDMVVYHPAKRQEGLRDGTLKELFDEEIKKSWEEYADQVGREVADSTPYFREALNEILAGGRQIF